MNIKQEFGLRLKEARKMRNMTQAELGKKSGIKPIAQFETPPNALVGIK
jgi:transcriptional regulator with XRE-family HTH domain